MRVALGTIEVDDDARKAIRKEAGGKGDATRGEVKDYLLTALKDEILPYIGVDDEDEEQPAPTPATAEDADEEGVAEEQHGTAPEPVSDEPLGDPTIGGTTGVTGSGAPGGGNLGAAGTPGGTV